MTVVLAALLIVEGLATGVRSAGTLPTIAVIYPWSVLALRVVRTAVGVGQFAGGWMLLRRHPFGRTLGGASLVASAALVTVEIGLRAVPGSLFPSYRWPVVGAYWVYALVGAWYLRSREKD